MSTITKLDYAKVKEKQLRHALTFSGGRRSPVASLDFRLPSELEASEPPEARGLARDEVRLMVSYRSSNEVAHTRFRDLPAYLEPSDLVIINTSGTLNAALPVTRPDGARLALHLSTRLPGDLWITELRQLEGETTRPYEQGIAGEILTLPARATATLLTPYLPEHRPNGPTRLWLTSLQLPEPLLAYLTHYGHPIRYYYVKQAWPSDYYQTVYATEPGSAEMPSAGRAFTPELITRLVAKGVQIAPLILHTGVASLEKHEPPYEEFYRVPLDTARRVNAARAAGQRVIAVGTTVVRALESVTDAQDVTHPGQGWTRLVITPECGLRAVNGMLTGLHEPEASHLAMLQALAGLEHLKVTYDEALRQSYLWHEFGDLHLMLP